MKISEFDYNLPHDLIAETPAKKRDSSRLLVLNKRDGTVSHLHFHDLPQLLQPGDVLVVNNSKVFPARLLGQKSLTGGRIEILLDHEIEPGLWQALGRNLKVSSRIIFPGSRLEAIVESRREECYLIKFSMSGDLFFQEIEKIGQIPLPPYINQKRKRVLSVQETKAAELADRERYQTVYAKDNGSAAAPTAGLHFTPEVMDNLKKMAVDVLEVTLHVGLGTFAPVKTEDVQQHKIHSEYYSVSSQVMEKIIKAKKDGQRIIAVGTTSTRVLEHIFSNKSLFDDSNIMHHSQSGWTQIFIYPGFEFKCIDGIITNFHLPKSSLLLLVSAFAGRDNIMTAYHEAVKEKYRFYSYGDAMLII